MSTRGLQLTETHGGTKGAGLAAHAVSPVSTVNTVSPVDPVSDVNPGSQVNAVDPGSDGASSAE